MYETIEQAEAQDPAAGGFPFDADWAARDEKEREQYDHRQQQLIIRKRCFESTFQSDGVRGIVDL